MATFDDDHCNFNAECLCDLGFQWVQNCDALKVPKGKRDISEIGRMLYSRENALSRSKYDLQILNPRGSSWLVWDILTMEVTAGYMVDSPIPNSHPHLPHSMC